MLPAEQRPLLSGDTTFEGLGSTPGQQFIVSMDWAVASLIFAALASTIFEPSKLALVRLRTDALGYFNWRDGYMAQMAVQSRQRDAWFSAQRKHVAARLKVRKVKKRNTPSRRTSSSPTSLVRIKSGKSQQVTGTSPSSGGAGASADFHDLSDDAIDNVESHV